ncbi:MAG: serine/threonine protein kinase [Deltaproteobacteria bacterium]|nr:serine/threonine protein kinase [Deltaproteobacteria bacterium]
MSTENGIEPFGPYTLFDKIGKGGMAEIFLGVTKNEFDAVRVVAIKKILPDLNTNVDFGDMLINEAKICANLSSKNVVETYELGKIDNQYYISMEYIEGVDLNKLLYILTKKQTPLPLEFILFIIIETLKGLDYAHRFASENGTPLNIIHRDVSPTNVLISSQGAVKLCDFGIARASFKEFSPKDHSPKDHSLDDSHIKGKISYMSPEHAQGQDIDRRSDLFSVGILLWELLNGRRLYKTKDHDETFKKVIEADIPPLADRGFPEFEMLDAILRKALAKEPDRRFSTGREFINAIEDYLRITELLVSEINFAQFLQTNLSDELAEEKADRGNKKLEALKLFNNTANKNEKPEKIIDDEPEDRFTLSLIAGTHENENNNIEDKTEKSSSKKTIVITAALILAAASAYALYYFKIINF